MKKMKIKPDHIQLNAEKLLSFLKEKKEDINPLLILMHDFPDPDAIASAFALQHIVESNYGVPSKMVYGGIIGRVENKELVHTLKIPVHKLRKNDFKKYSNVALVDTQPNFKNNPFPKSRRSRIVLDQHPSEEKPNADLSIVDPDCGATSVILAQALLILGKEIPVRIATALAYGIISDTLNLYRAKHPKVIRVYLDILPYCDLRALARIQNPSALSRSFFVSLGKGIQTAVKCRSLIFSHLGDVKNPDLVSQIADFLLTYKGIRWSLTTGRYNGKLHVSLRTSTPNAQAGEVLRDIFDDRGDAGGHGSIGGGSFKIGKNRDEAFWIKVEKELVQRFMRRVRIPLKVKWVYPFRG